MAKAKGIDQVEDTEDLDRAVDTADTADTAALTETWTIDTHKS